MSPGVTLAGGGRGGCWPALAAGTINTIVGSGTLITFPVLLAVGYPPVLANVSNTVGLASRLGQRGGRLPRRAASGSGRD